MSRADKIKKNGEMRIEGWSARKKCQGQIKVRRMEG